jgi:molybdopterin converting factor small subunit
MADRATITIVVPSALRAFSGAPAEIPIAAPDLRALLVELERSHHAFFRSVCDETGTVRRHVNVFVNTSHMRDLAGLDTALASGDVVTFLPAVSGG